MFKFKSYNVSKETAKNEKEGAKTSFKPSSSSLSSSSSSSSSLTGTLRKNPKIKEKPSAEQIRHVNNKSSPEYLKKSSSTKNTTEWHKNKTYSAKPKEEKVVIPSPHKKLERK